MSAAQSRLVVYAKTPMAGPAAVLGYLSRDTQRTAIGNEWLQGLLPGHVQRRVRAKDAQGSLHGKGSIALDGAQFIGRLLQHVLPTGFKRVRQGGLLAPLIENGVPRHTA